MIPLPPVDQATRQRLLEAAGEVFAELGYRDATVREICRRANANVAAINYHFGDKARLYSETFRHLITEAIKQYPPDMGIAAGATAEEKLHAFIRSFFLRVLSGGRGSLYGRLMVQEMARPTDALRERFVESLKPMGDRLLSIVRELLPGATEDELRRAACSVVGQIVFHHHCRPTIALMFPDAAYDAEEIEALARHVTGFSLAALRGMGEAGWGATNAEGNAER